MSALEAVQGLFMNAVTGEAAPTAPEVWVKGNGALDAIARLAIYADMFWWRQIDVLKADCPKLLAVLGDDGFAELARAYLEAHPSTAPSVALLGRHLPAFLDANPRWGMAARDLARLEWARSEVFDEADAEVVGPELLSSTPPDALEALHLPVIPALRLLELEHDVTVTWKRLDEGGEVPEPAAEKTSAVVWRQGLRVFHVRISETEAQALRLALQGLPLAEICEPFAELDVPVVAAMAAIGSWLAEGFIRAVPENP